MSLRTFGPHEVGSKYHVEWPVMKHVENSVQGIRHCHRRHIRTIDLDILPDEVAVRHGQYAKHIPNTHWERPLRRDKFRDPKGILHRDDRIQEMVPDEWRRLKAGYATVYRIHPIEHQLRLCHRLNVQALVEPKESAVFLRPAFWVWFAGVCEETQVRIGIYSLMHDCIPYARNAGFEAWKIKG